MCAVLYLLLENYFNMQSDPYVMNLWGNNFLHQSGFINNEVYAKLHKVNEIT